MYRRMESFPGNPEKAKKSVYNLKIITHGKVKNDVLNSQKVQCLDILKSRQWTLIYSSDFSILIIKSFIIFFGYFQGILTLII